MDPNELLLKIRDQIQDWREGDYFNADRFTDDVENLDTWISTGGFLPKDWERRRS